MRAEEPGSEFNCQLNLLLNLKFPHEWPDDHIMQILSLYEVFFKPLSWPKMRYKSRINFIRLLARVWKDI